jgi:pyrroline-5-carboxylate reductase
MECLINAAQELGLPEDLSKLLVQETLWGSVHLLEKNNMDAQMLRVKVTSKGGTTQAALDVLKKNDFQGILTQALLAAKKRARELSRR